jgi:ATP-dependent RNA helicase MSS116
LKGKVDHNTLKALTVKPFQLSSMSEVQKRVLSLMPELAGGRPKRSEEENAEIEEEAVMQTNVAGQKVSTAARGKHDLLVKAKTGTGKTIVRLHESLI